MSRREPSWRSSSSIHFGILGAFVIQFLSKEAAAFRCFATISAFTRAWWSRPFNAATRSWTDRTFPPNSVKHVPMRLGWCASLPPVCARPIFSAAQTAF